MDFVAARVLVFVKKKKELFSEHAAIILVIFIMTARRYQVREVPSFSSFFHFVRVNSSWLSIWILKTKMIILLGSTSTVLQ